MHPPVFKREKVRGKEGENSAKQGDPGPIEKMSLLLEWGIQSIILPERQAGRW